MTNGRTDGRTDRPTRSFIKMRCRKSEMDAFISFSNCDNVKERRERRLQFLSKLRQMKWHQSHFDFVTLHSGLLHFRLEQCTVQDVGHCFKVPQAIVVHITVTPNGFLRSLFSRCKSSCYGCRKTFAIQLGTRKLGEWKSKEAHTFIGAHKPLIINDW